MPVSFTKYSPEGVDGIGAHIRRDIAGFQFAQELVDQDAVQISMAILARYSWERCMGFRSCKAAMVFQPLSSKILRVSPGRM